jgi:FAD/FMN-containing dehydrogenase
MPPLSGLELIARTTPQRTWQNWHQNFVQPVHEVLDLWNAKPATSDFTVYRETTRGLQTLVGRAAREGLSLRALGGSWSFSPVAATDGIVLNTRPLNYRFRFSSQGTVDPQYQRDASNLFFAQCGNSLAELNEYLRSMGKALKTSGASNGQTIAGAMSTGTHGSAFGFGGVQEYVVGLHLIVGANRHVWLERASDPVIAPAIPTWLGAELVRDDGLFNAALVSMGSFGLIHGVLFEAEPLYYLQVFRGWRPLNDALWRAMEHLDFSGLTMPRPATEQPYHFEVLVNPHDIAAGAFVKVMYKDAKRPPDGQPLPKPGKIAQGDDALEAMGVITNLASSVTPLVVNLLMKRLFTEEKGVCGTHGEIFRDTSTRGKAASTAMGIPLGSVRQATDIGLELNKDNEVGPFPGLFGYRYVKASQATLAFTRHAPATCVFELDGPWSDGTRKFYRRMWQAMDASGIPYTFHWGKIHGLDAARVRQMYPDPQNPARSAVDAWCEARRGLFKDSPKSDQVFANQWLRGLGMDT